MSKKERKLQLPEVTPELGHKVVAACKKGCKGDLSRDLFTTCCRAENVAAVDVVAVTRHFFPELRDTEPLPIAFLVTAIDGWLAGLQQAA